MAFTLQAAGTSYPNTPYSSPYAVSLVATDDGSGGTININMLAGVAAGAVDLKTFFGAAFKSTALARAFKAIATNTTTAAQNQFVPQVDVIIVPVVTGLAAMPGVGYLASAGVPYLQLVGPSVAGSWRVTIKLKHSIDT